MPVSGWRDGGWRDGDHGRLLERPTNNRGGLQHASLLRRQSVQPGADERFDAVRDADVCRVALGEPAVSATLDHALFDQHADNLLDKERVAISLEHDLLYHFSWQPAASRHPGNQGFDAGTVEAV